MAASRGLSARPAPARQFSSQVRFSNPGRRTFIRNNNFRNNNRVGFRNFHRHRFFPNNFCFNGGFADPFVCNNGLFNAGLFYGPYYPFDNGYAYQQEQQPQVVVSDDGSNRELAFEVERLTDEVATMREESARREVRDGPPQRISATPEAENTILVFRDGHQVTIQNYAVAGNTLWILSEHAAKKVVIADLDVPATQQANEKNGVEFRVPGAH
jgi:hypothetical protein